MCIRENNLFHNDISSHFKFLFSNDRLDFCDFFFIKDQKDEQCRFTSLCAHIILALMVNRFGLMSAMEGSERQFYASSDIPHRQKDK